MTGMGVAAPDPPELTTHPSVTLSNRLRDVEGLVVWSLRQVQKKKIWEELQPMLLTDHSGVAGFNGVPMLTSAGPVTSKTLTAAHIS